MVGLSLALDLTAHRQRTSPASTVLAGLLFGHPKVAPGNPLNLTELLAVTTIIGTLSALALASMTAAKESARYAEAGMKLGAIAREIEIYRAETGRWPSDTARANEAPDGAGALPDMPHDADLDYEHWSDGATCYVFLGYGGKRNVRAWRFYERPKPGRDRRSDAVVRMIAEYPCQVRKGPVR